MIRAQSQLLGYHSPDIFLSVRFTASLDTAAHDALRPLPHRAHRATRYLRRPSRRQQQLQGPDRATDQPREARALRPQQLNHPPADQKARQILRSRLHLHAKHHRGVYVYRLRLHRTSSLTSSNHPPHPPTSQLTWSQNHNPLAQNGSDSAWSILSPIWASQILTSQRTTFHGSQSWLEYENAVLGKVVDRFRWEGGCIVEHVSVEKKAEVNEDADYRYSGIRGRCFRVENHFYTHE